MSQIVHMRMHPTNLHRYILAMSLLVLVACGPSEKQKAQLAEEQRNRCLDERCEGDVEPKHDRTIEVALKLDGRWFIGPRNYFSTGTNGAGFEWWEHKALDPRVPRPPEAQVLAVQGHGDELQVQVLLRSNHIPSPPYGYAFIELAQRNDWIAERRTLRTGLDAVQMKSVMGPRGQAINHVTYYIATRLVGPDGLPPVATCSHDDPRNGGGSGFMWKPGIWAGIRMNQRHCADWPEIYQEITRVMQLLKEAT